MPTGANGGSRLGYWFITPIPPVPPPEPPVNPTPINNLADYIKVDYTFTNGLDLDTRTKVTVPSVQGDWCGWGRASQQSNVLYWGGDNTGTGVESVLLNIANFRAGYPASTSIRVEFNCFWYSLYGSNGVTLTMTLWTGGTPVRSGYSWVNNSATATQVLASTSKDITLITRSSASNGQPLGYIIYDVNTGVGSLDIYA